MNADQKSRVAEMLALKYTAAEIGRELRMPVRDVYLIKAQIRREASPGLIDTKACAQCGAAFERPYGVGAIDWAARKYCGRPCANMASRGQGGSGPERRCKHCDAILIRRDNERGSSWKYRRFCDHGCAAKARAARRAAQSKHCQQCGVVMVRGYRECARDWLARRFCSQQCNISSRTVTPRPDQVKRLFDPLPGRMFAIYDRIIAERGLNDWYEAAILCGMAA